MNKAYKLASIGAIIFAPSASLLALFFASRQWLLDEYAINAALAFIGAIVVAIGLELVGFMSGHLTSEALARWGVDVVAWSPLFLIAYVIFGIAAVTHVLPIHTASFIITLIAYILYSVVVKVETIADEQADNKAWEREQKALDLQTKRDIAKMRATVPQVARQVDSQPQVNHPASVDSLTPAQLRVYTAIKDNPQATYDEIGDMLGVSKQAISKHARNMNGLVKELRQ